METLELILCIALIVLAVFLVVTVLLQSGKSNKLSGTITGASSDSFYGKTKGRTADAILSKLTAIAAVLFALIVIVVFVLQARTAEPATDTGATTDNQVTVDDGKTESSDEKDDASDKEEESDESAEKAE